MGSQAEDAARQKRSNTLPCGCIVDLLSFAGRLGEGGPARGCNCKKTQEYSRKPDDGTLSSQLGTVVALL